MLGFVGGERLPHRVDRIGVRPQRRNRKLENSGHAALGFRCHRGGIFRSLGEYAEDMGGRYLADGQLADVGKYHPFQHF